MTTYGITATGFTPEDQNSNRSDLDTAVQAARGLSVDVSDGSPTGFYNGIVSEAQTSLWDLLQSIYSSFDPDKATGAALDSLSALTGTFRIQAASSQVTATLTGTPTTVVPANSQAKTLSTGAVFYTQAANTIVTVPAWATGAIALGQRVTSSGNIYQCYLAGTATTGHAPTGTNAPTGLAITGDGVGWQYLGQGTGAVDCTMLSVVQDAIPAAASDLIVIQTPIGGWYSVINVTAASLGNLVQTDESLRITREAELASTAGDTFNGMYGVLTKLPSATTPAVTIFENNTATATTNPTLPPYSFMAMIYNTTATNNQIAQTIFNNKPLGGAVTAGTSSGTAIDASGNSHTINFQTPTATPVFVIVTVVYDPTPGVYQGDQAVRLAVANYLNTLPPGRNVFATGITGAIFAAGLGVLDIPRSGSEGGVLLGTSASPTTDATITLDPIHIAVVTASTDSPPYSSHITINSSAGSL